MRNTYFDLIDQTYYFPQEGFDLNAGHLEFHGVSLIKLIEKHNTPFRLVYLPKVREQIIKAKQLFEKSIKQYSYKGNYHYCYCTKCSHFAHVIKTALKENVHLETSSSFDIDLILRLLSEGQISYSTILVHNGYKTPGYLEKIVLLNKMGFKNSILVIDSIAEIDRIRKYAAQLEKPLKIGFRMAIDEEPQSAYYTSRLGIKHDIILDKFHQEIKNDKNLKLKMLHFFVDSGIRDNLYYWGEFQKALKLYVELKKECPGLIALNLGGGFPIKNHLGFDYDYGYMVSELVRNISEKCREENIDEPDIFTEFGKYTVGEAGATIFSVLEKKEQNDAEIWYVVDNSLMNTIPDAWSILEKFILLPINKWDREYTRVNIGGISCDHSDYYNSEELNQQIHLPVISNEEKAPLYLGFFHTGAYQDSISGYGGIKHCLIPSPKHIIVDYNENGQLVDTVYRHEQTVDEMLDILGYNIDLEKC